MLPVFMRCNFYSAVLAAAWLFVLPPAPAAAGDPAEGETKTASCRSCHGADGNSPFENIPSLAAQPATYIGMQVFLYRENQRKIPEMNAAVAHLTDRDIADIAAYFERQKPSPPPADANSKRMARGQALARQHHCDFCHLPNFAGQNQMPRLAGQREDYLVKAMHDYKSGTRPGFDGMMVSVLQPVDEAGIRDLAYYLARLR